MELIMASCVCGYHVYGENWIVALGEELYCEQDITMQSDAAMAHDGIKLENVPLGLGKVLQTLWTSHHDENHEGN